MKTVYDMVTGRIIRTDPPAETPRRLDLDAPYAELRLQPVVHETRPEKPLPPELVMADLNAFIDKMS
ncbi:MAG: hypothetical protein P8178_02590 [Candidatus Thiodiazotropha sp.]|jgi:hypothetical protein